MAAAETKIEAQELPSLWQRFKATNDPLLRDRLICHYLYLIKYVVGKLLITLPPHVKAEDLYSTGVLGLVRAIERYDITKQNKFDTYALFVIRGAIIDELRALDWVPRSVHKKASQLADAQMALRKKLAREPSDPELANELGLTEKEYHTLLIDVRPTLFIPLETSVNDDPDSLSLSERIRDEKAATSFELADKNERRALLRKAVQELPEQERSVLSLYYYDNLMLKEIAKALGVSESRISQIHTKAISSLKSQLKEIERG